MNTDDLIQLLASDTVTGRPRVWRRRYALALGAGLIGAIALMLMILGLRPDLGTAVLLPMFWVKFAFPVALVAGALLATVRLSRPGVPLGRVAAAIAAPVLAIWVLAVIALLGASPAERSALIWGDTWTTCPANVTMLSMPAFIALFWVMKTLAPTQLRLAGAAAGLLAGALGAAVYALHCPEMGAPFLGIWYVIGMLIPATLGALIGPRLLRW
jgi:hypothetical protein